MTLSSKKELKCHNGIRAAFKIPTAPVLSRNFFADLYLPAFRAEDQPKRRRNLPGRGGAIHRQPQRGMNEATTDCCGCLPDNSEYLPYMEEVMSKTRNKFSVIAQEAIGQKIKERRETLGYSLEQTALIASSFCGLTRERIRQIESAAEYPNCPSVESLYAISLALSCNASDFLPDTKHVVEIMHLKPTEVTITVWRSQDDNE